MAHIVIIITCKIVLMIMDGAVLIDLYRLFVPGSSIRGTQTEESLHTRRYNRYRCFLNLNFLQKTAAPEGKFYLRTYAHTSPKSVVSDFF